MNESQPPPLRDLPPGRLDQRAEHLRAEIVASKPWVRRSSVFALAAACTVLSAGLFFAFLPSSSKAPHNGGADAPFGGVRMVPWTNVVGDVFTISAKLEVPKGWSDGLAWITVRRFRGQAGTDPRTVRSDVAYDESTVVYDEHAQMFPLSVGDESSFWKWSGSLSPADWTRGCARGAFYRVDVLLGDPNGYSVSAWTPWFRCQTGAAGPTGTTGPTGAH